MTAAVGQPAALGPLPLGQRLRQYRIGRDLQRLSRLAANFPVQAALQAGYERTVLVLINVEVAAAAGTAFKPKHDGLQ